MTTLLARSDELIHVGRILEASGHALHAHQTVSDVLGFMPRQPGERIIRAFLQRDGT